MKQPKITYICSECEYQVNKWMGKCPSCGSWNSFDEYTPEVQSATAASSRHTAYASDGAGVAEPLDSIDLPEHIRSETGFGEFDRVLGGGLVNGSVVLLSGEPGIGKSTLLMQICGSLGKSKRLLYVSGEESRSQLKLRAKRLGISSSSVYLLNETLVDSILRQIDEVQPDVVIIDSVQTLYNGRVSSAPGSVTQVRESALALISKAKNDGISVILVGHVNKEGGISGPKILEHMVDAVLSFEGDRRQLFRVIRAMKNRYGSTNEIGVFEMTDEGLREVPNPSEVMLSDRPDEISGSCAVCVMEGSRPIIVEIQALVSQTVFPAPRRTANGVDYNRMCMILAVLEKRLGLRFSANDVYLNVTGGMRLDDPSSDLAIALAMISGIADSILPPDVIAFGEIGLSGECRTVSNAEQRVKEAARLGFKKILLPRACRERVKDIEGVELIGVGSIFETLKFLKKEAK